MAGFPTLLVTLTLDQVILHTVMHHSSISNYMPNYSEIGETFCGRTDVCTDRPALLGQLSKSRPKNGVVWGH